MFCLSTRYTFILPHHIDTIDLTSQSNISTLQTQTLNVSSNLGRNQTLPKMSDTKEINKSNNTVERFYYNDSSQFVENYDYTSQISIS